MAGSFDAQQLLYKWVRNESRKDDPLLWGDEVRFVPTTLSRYTDVVQTKGILIHFDNEERKTEPYLGSTGLIAQCEEDLLYQRSKHERQAKFILQQELGRFNLETTPEIPWAASAEGYLDVENNMQWRRARLRNPLGPNRAFLTIGSYPLLGSSDNEPSESCNQHSQLLKDDIISSPYQQLVASIRERRGTDVNINVPVFRDEDTPWPFYDPIINQEPRKRLGKMSHPIGNHIHGDSPLFAHGCCSLQVTIQNEGLEKARYLHDQLITIAPIMLALTAATPFLKGYLTDTDTRWPMLQAGCDDRTPDELTTDANERPFLKPRCASNNAYISSSHLAHPSYQDPDLVINPDIKRRLLCNGMDDMMATYFANIFIRDHLQVARGEELVFDIRDDTHFLNLNANNWNTVRFKPPTTNDPKDASDGWKVEFRPMEVQMTDFENAAFAVFIVLLAQTILHFDLNLYIPIPTVDENMERASARDAVIEQEFFWRKHILPTDKQPKVHNPNMDIIASIPESALPYGRCPPAKESSTAGSAFHETTINEIMNGPPPSPSHSPSQSGLIPLIRDYISTQDSLKSSKPFLSKITAYLDFISARASGALWTSAKWQREFALRHPEYQRDSRVRDGVGYDLLKAVRAISDVNGVCDEAARMRGEKWRRKILWELAEVQVKEQVR